MNNNSFELPKNFKLSNLKLSTLRQTISNQSNNPVSKLNALKSNELSDHTEISPESNEQNKESNEQNQESNGHTEQNENSQKIIHDPNAIKIGDRLELLVDDKLIKNITNLRRQVHQPIAREVSFIFNKPWEGNVSAYYTLIKEDANFFRLYYRGADINVKKMHLGITEGNGQRTCYAESHNGGRTWTRPNLGLFEYIDDQGNKLENNIIWTDVLGSENFTPFKDTNPNCKPDEKYKAIGSRLNPYLLFGFSSADGINWKMMNNGKPLLTLYHGKFDTQNVVFWNENINKYMMFYRDCINRRTNLGRGTRVCVSTDFIRWTNFSWLYYNDSLNQINYQLYTNCVQKYYRAPHYLIAFPNRFNRPRQAIPGHPQSGVFDAIFMSSRNGYQWNRTSQAIFRPGPQLNRWATRNNQIVLGMFETPSTLSHTPNEISILSCEGYYLNLCALRRYTWRLDGFVSLQADLDEGELITKSLVFSGNHLVLNLSTSAIGWIKVEIQDGLSDQPIRGFEMNNCVECFGDEINKKVYWKRELSNSSDVSQLAGKSIKLKLRLKDCDLYSFKFID